MQINRHLAAILIAAAVLLGPPLAALAQTGTSKSGAALNTEVNSLWPDNTSGAITPFNSRQTLLDLIASYPNLNAVNGPPTWIGFTQSGGGAVQRTLDAKLKDTIWIKDFGAVGDGSTDDTTAFQNALNAVPAGGALLIDTGKYLIGNVTVPSYVSIIGQNGYPDVLLTNNVGASNPYNLGSQLRLKASSTITMGNGVRLSRLVVIHASLSLPATTNSQATTLLTQFADTAVTASQVDIEIEHCAFFGFNLALNISNSGGTNTSNRIRIHDNIGDNNGFITFNGSGDRSFIENNHLFPFLTFSIPSVTDTNLQRAGPAISLLNNDTALVVKANLTFGYGYAFRCQGCSTQEIVFNHFEYTATGGGTDGVLIQANGGTQSQYIRLIGNFVIGYSHGVVLDATNAPTGNDTFHLIGNSIINGPSATGVELVVGYLIATENLFQNHTTALLIDSGATGGMIYGNRFVSAVTAITNNATTPSKFILTPNDGYYPLQSLLRYVVYATAVNFNSANTDTAIAVNLPPGVSNYLIQNVRIANASATLTTATWGLFSATGGGGTAIVAAGQAITVNTASSNTNNNAQSFALANGNTQSWNFATVYFRVGTAQGSAATGDVLIEIVPLY